MLSYISALLAMTGIVRSAPFAAVKRDSCPTYMVIEAPGLGDLYGSWTEPTTDQLLAGLAGGERYVLKSAWSSSLCVMTSC